MHEPDIPAGATMREYLGAFLVVQPATGGYTCSLLHKKYRSSGPPDGTGRVLAVPDPAVPDWETRSIPSVDGGLHKSIDDAFRVGEEVADLQLRGVV